MRIKNEMKNTSASWFLDVVRTGIEFIFRFINGDKTFYSTDNLDWIKDFENNFPSIKEEYNQLIQKNVFIPSWQSISDDPNVRIGNDWKTFILKGYDKFVIRNCNLCPETYKLIKKYPFIYTTWFSVLEAGKKIPEHRGPYNGILRYHLALKVPTDAQNCYIKVGNDIAHWKEGKSLLFDDTHLHAVWNNTNETRVILFVDVERPMPFPFNYINRFIIKQIGKSKFVTEVFDKLNS